MEQLTQKLKSGEMTVQELPWPQVGPGIVLVRNHFSLISAGTEGATVKTARASMLAKAKERPQQVKQVLEVLRKQGPVQTYRAVMKKLDAYSPLGYSCAGEVVEVGGQKTEDRGLKTEDRGRRTEDGGLRTGDGGGVSEYKVGDLVACAGAGYANHAEVVAVPVNLCVKLESDADLKQACYNTLGAIALQGIRQADLRLGETCAVIGLGLIGQLTCLMLRASGVKVAGVDVDKTTVDTAQKHCADLALTRSTPGITDEINQFTGGLGTDAVIITAGTASLDPINFAGEIARKKGRVIVVGTVPTGFDRENYYNKELDLRMSCSYGPGRYDPEYEEKGIDYPPAYVRWTEKRNMQAFQDLLYTGQIDLGYLTTHEVPLEQAPQAYDMIMNRSESFLGIVIRYDTDKSLSREAVKVGESQSVGKSKIGLAFIGAGSYAQGNLLPNLPKNDGDVVCQGVMTNYGTTSKRVAEKFGFAFCTEDEEDILNNDDINTVFIATRHDTHGEYVQKALQSGKHVFVEKPLGLTVEELVEIGQFYRGEDKIIGGQDEGGNLTESLDGRIIEGQDEGGNLTESLDGRIIGGQEVHAGRPQLMVGFNRRFATLAVMMKQRLGQGPKSMIYRVNAGSIPADHWIQDKQVGGGRIIGEACHFIDFLTFLTDALPVTVYASALSEPDNLHDTVSINIEFSDGSVGTVNYFANGSKSMPKEYVEVFQSGMTLTLDDFRELKVYGNGKPERKKLMSQDKGQAAMVKAFLTGLKNGTGSPIVFEQLRAVSLAAIAAERSITERLPVRIHE